MIYDKILSFLGNTLGANPNTLATTSKTLVGAINEIVDSVEDLEEAVVAEHNRIHISTSIPSPSDGNDGDLWIVYDASI